MRTPASGTRHSPISPGCTRWTDGRVALRASAGGRVGDSQAAVRSGSGALACSRSLPTTHGSRPRLRSRTTSTPVPPFARVSAAGALCSPATRATSGSTRTVGQAGDRAVEPVAAGPDRLELLEGHADRTAGAVQDDVEGGGPARRDGRGAGAAGGPARPTASRDRTRRSARSRGPELPSRTSPVPGQVRLPVLRTCSRTVVAPRRGTTTVWPSAKTAGGASRGGLRRATGDDRHPRRGEPGVLDDDQPADGAPRPAGRRRAGPGTRGGARRPGPRRRPGRRRRRRSRRGRRRRCRCSGRAGRCGRRGRRPARRGRRAARWRPAAGQGVVPVLRRTAVSCPVATPGGRTRRGAADCCTTSLPTRLGGEPEPGGAQAGAGGRPGALL